MLKKTMFIGALLTLALLVSGAGASGAAVGTERRRAGWCPAWMLSAR